jgi:hypothetical protein
VRFVIFCVLVSLSSAGCIYGEMNDTNSTESTSECNQLVTAVCRDCSNDLCEYYENTVNAGNVSEEQCSQAYDSLVESGC